MLSCRLQTSPRSMPIYPNFVPKEESELLWGACNFKLSLTKLPTPALKAENCDSGQSEPCFPVIAAMHETSYFLNRGFQSLLLLL